MQLRHRGVANEAPSSGSPIQERRTIPLFPHQTHQTAGDDIPSPSLFLSLFLSFFLSLPLHSFGPCRSRPTILLCSTACTAPHPVSHRATNAAVYRESTYQLAKGCGLQFRTLQIHRSFFIASISLSSSQPFQYLPTSSVTPALL